MKRQERRSMIRSRRNSRPNGKKSFAEEARKARLILETDIEGKAKEIVDLQEVLKDRDVKLAEAQKTQVEILR